MFPKWTQRKHPLLREVWGSSPRNFLASVVAKDAFQCHFGTLYSNTLTPYPPKKCSHQICTDLKNGPDELQKAWKPEKGWPLLNCNPLNVVQLQIKFVVKLYKIIFFPKFFFTWSPFGGGGSRGNIPAGLSYWGKQKCNETLCHTFSKPYCALARVYACALVWQTHAQKRPPVSRSWLTHCLTPRLGYGISLPIFLSISIFQ